jgi:membrane fusion protein (multidrug efflux system)
MRPKKLALIAALGAGAVGLLVVLPTLMRPSAQDRGKRPERAVAVEAAAARGATTTTDIRAIGSLRSDESVQIASEIAGRIEKINFTEGGTVGEGDVLLKLDDALAEAQVADAKARFELAESNNERAKKLSPSGFVTGKAIDEATATFETARATLELERVRLAKHVIKAPFPGVVGLRKVSPGSFIGVGTTIVNIEKIDVLKVDFKLPEQFLPSVNVGQTVDVIVDAYPGRTFVGEIYAIDPLVDVNGRALALRARLPNADMALRPGLFARVLVKGKQTREVVLVPESAIVPRGGETFVFRIDAGKAMETRVKLGERHGAEVEIVEGVLPNTQVVTAGQIKLRNGVAVEVLDPEAPTRKAAAKKNGT